MRNKRAKIIRKVALSVWDSLNDKDKSIWNKKSKPLGNGLKCYYRHLKKRGA